MTRLLEVIARAEDQPAPATCRASRRAITIPSWPGPRPALARILIPTTRRSFARSGR